MALAQVVQPAVEAPDLRCKQAHVRIRVQEVQRVGDRLVGKQHIGVQDEVEVAIRMAPDREVVPRAVAAVAAGLDEFDAQRCAACRPRQRGHGGNVPVVGLVIDEVQRAEQRAL